jgi:hypothetical protein
MGTRVDTGTTGGGAGSGGDVRLIAGTATAATVTAVVAKASVASAPTVVAVGIFASPTLAANTSRKSMWFQNAGATGLFLGFGATPSASSYHLALASATAAGTGAAYFDSEWLGAVYVISNVASGSVCFAETT